MKATARSSVLRPMSVLVAAMTICVVGFGLGSSAEATVASATGSVEASAAQTDPATGHIFDSAYEATPQTTNILPAQAQAELPILNNGVLHGHVRSFGGVNLPQTDGPAVEGDFGVEASGLSIMTAGGFGAEARATQTRYIILGAAELDLPAGALINVSSQFVLSAGAALIRLPGCLQDVVAEVSLTVVQETVDGRLTVIDGSFAVSLNDAGEPVVTPAGDMVGTTPLFLRTPAGHMTLDESHVILLPAVVIPYEYRVYVGETFSLKADIVAEVTAQSGLQGASAFIGVTPLALYGSLQDVLDVNLGDLLEANVEDQMQLSKVVAPPVTEIKAVSELPGCGNFGLEWLFGGMLLSIGMVVRRS